jgi:hypothetical protein
MNGLAVLLEAPGWTSEVLRNGRPRFRPRRSGNDGDFPEWPGGSEFASAPRAARILRPAGPPLPEAAGVEAHTLSIVARSDVPETIDEILACEACGRSWPPMIPTITASRPSSPWSTWQARTEPAW